MVKPYEQGALDGLCGVYCIVNASRIISGNGEDESRQLFQEIIYYLDRTKDLPKILITGMGLQTIGAILADVVGGRINNRAMPFKQYPDTPLDAFWGEMMNFMGGGERRAILTAIGGPMWDHWSIVESITDRQVRFFDSYKLKRLNRSRCATMRCTASRPHLLSPTHTYFLS
jgi:hypothetical protein